MNKIVISGGPHSGKTTLLRALQAEFPQYEYLPEPASIVLSEAANGESLYWREVFNSPLKFCTLCMEQSIKSEHSIHPDSEYVFMDRSLIDTIAYARRDGCEELIPTVASLAQRAMYDTVLFCEPVGILRDRTEDEAEAILTHNLLKSAYSEMGIPIVPIPPVAIEERVNLVREKFNL
jgi:predicted ATPase